jgi:multidrug efflux pump subunit AcrB
MDVRFPMVLAAISGDGLDETVLYKIGYYAVRNKMGGLKGVQIPHPFGGRFRQMMVYVDPARLQAHDLTLTDVVEAVRNSNLVLGSGTLRLGEMDYQVHSVNTLPDIAARTTGRFAGSLRSVNGCSIPGGPCSDIRRWS